MPISGSWRHVAAASAIAIGANVAEAQPQGGGGQLPPPVFDSALVFTVNAGFPYGLAAADILDASGNPGQDGYPEIAVSGSGVNRFGPFLFCDDGPVDRYIRIYHNKGATVAWDGSAPHGALELHQTISIGAAAPGVWAMELATGDVTGNGHTDLVLVGLDPDHAGGDYGRVLVFENLGFGLFDSVPIENIETTVPLRGVEVRDFDLDGDIDIIAAADVISSDWACSQGSQDVVLKVQNLLVPTGTFSLNPLPPDDLQSGAAPGDLACGDFYAYSSGTPLMDLVAPNPTAGSVSSVANLGGLSLNPTTVDPPMGCSWPYITVTAGLFGADPDWDFAAVDANDLFADVFEGDGNGGFTSTCATGPYKLLTTTAEGMRAHGIHLGKIDNGPYPDLAVALGLQFSIGTEGFDHYGAVAVLLGKADGTFQTESPQHAYIFLADNENDPTQPLAAGSVNVMVIDLDADGFDNIVVANHLVNDGDNSDTISVLINALEVRGLGP